MLEGQVFKSYGQGSTCLYKGFQPAMKVLDPTIGGQEIFSEYIEETFERELQTATNEVQRNGSYDTVTKKILLLGEMDMMPTSAQGTFTKVFDYPRMTQNLDPDYMEVLTKFPLEKRRGALRETSGSIYEHGCYSATYVDHLNRPFPLSMMDGAGAWREALDLMDQLKDEDFKAGYPWSPDS